MKQTIFTALANQLVGGYTMTKSEEIAEPEDLEASRKAFSKIKSFWGKACFLFYLKKFASTSLSACGEVIEQELKMREAAVYERQIKLHMNDIRMMDFRGQFDEIGEGVKERLMEYGEEEFLILCITIFQSGNEWISEIKGVSLDRKKFATIKNGIK